LVGIARNGLQLQKKISSKAKYRLFAVHLQK